MSSKTIKGQAWIQGDSLVQEQILIAPGLASSTNVISLIPDIWADLTSGAGKYKTNGKGYFWWEIKVTDMNEDSEVTIKYECPRPKEGLYLEPYDLSKADGEYSKYWIGRLKAAVANYEASSAIQKKEIVFPGTSYINQNGNLVELTETKENNSDIGDITNLLGMF